MPSAANPAAHSQASLDSILADFDEAAPLDEATTIPGSWYTDPRVAELERRTVWSRTWQLVARVDQLQEPGSYVTAVVAGEPIVVVRGADRVLRGFFNVCRHHAAAVCTQAEGCVEKLRCPYHGWTYGLDGAFKSAPEMGRVKGLEPAALGLVPVAVAEWEKFVFVHLDPEPPSLRSWVGELGERVRPLSLEGLRFAERREWTLDRKSTRLNSSHRL